MARSVSCSRGRKVWRGGSAWTTTAKEMPRSTPETMMGWCPSMSQSPPGKSQFTVGEHGRTRSTCAQRLPQGHKPHRWGKVAKPAHGSTSTLWPDLRPDISGFCLQLAAFESVMGRKTLLGNKHPITREIQAEAGWDHSYKRNYCTYLQGRRPELLVFCGNSMGMRQLIPGWAHGDKALQHGWACPVHFLGFVTSWARLWLPSAFPSCLPCSRLRWTSWDW